MATERGDRRAFWRSPGGIAFCAFIAVVGLLLVLEHRAHVLGALPLVLILLCVGMHLFMHGGHGSRGHDRPSGHDNGGDDGR